MFNVEWKYGAYLIFVQRLLLFSSYSYAEKCRYYVRRVTSTRDPTDRQQSSNYFFCTAKHSLYRSVEQLGKSRLDFGCCIFCQLQLCRRHDAEHSWARNSRRVAVSCYIKRKEKKEKKRHKNSRAQTRAQIIEIHYNVSFVSLLVARRETGLKSLCRTISRFRASSSLPNWYGKGIDGDSQRDNEVVRACSHVAHAGSEMKGRSTSLNVKKFSESSYFASKDHNLMTRLHTFNEVDLYACTVVSMGDLRNSSASAIDRLSRECKSNASGGEEKKSFNCGRRKLQFFYTSLS